MPPEGYESKRECGYCYPHRHEPHICQLLRQAGMPKFMGYTPPKQREAK